MEIIVACPKCNYELHLPSRDLLGRKGKCPGCAHKFIMEEPKKPAPEPAEPRPAKSKSAAPPSSEARITEEPPVESAENDDVTTYDSGKTRAEPLPAPTAQEFKQLQDPAPAPKSKAQPTKGKGPAKERDSSEVEAELDGTDSAEVPAELWEMIPTSESKPPPAADSRPANEIVARCPCCHAAVDFRRDDDLRDFPCSHCGQSFSLIHPEASPEALGMPAQVGNYSLQKQPRIGVGPFGNVYRAKDGQSGDSIVIKVARGDQVSEEEMPKFLANLKSVMQLMHPSIATLKELDEVDGRVYLVSNLATGIDLSEYLTGRPGRQLTIREVASTCALVASVLHHAHRFGVVHGNLKPSNIRLDGNLKPTLLDFGLANRQSSARLTGNGRVVGTASYLAPEQLPETRREPDAQTDVFALGVIFYELLTGRRPFPGRGADLFKQIAAGSPPPPRAVNSQIPKALDIICMKCLQLKPKDRYQSAMDVYKELRLYLEDKPIHTKPPGLVTRLSRWCRRKPGMAIFLTGVLLAIAGAGFVGWKLWQDGGFS